MNILMMTNTYTPHVGGVARSVAAFSEQYRAMGHQVIVVAPEFEGMPVAEKHVVRVPAIQKFNGSDFSVCLPVFGRLTHMLDEFKPDIVHSHHPFLIGSIALRIASQYNVPHVFTHHTRYEEYTHYVPGDSPLLKRFVIQLGTHYANLCSHVFAPSASLATTLQQRLVTVPISVVPTGVQLDKFACGSGAGFRQVMNIPEQAFVVGHVGRLASEKNLEFLADALSLSLQNNPQAFCLIVGSGPEEGAIKHVFTQRGVQDRLIMQGLLTGPMLVSAYKAMDVFAFSSLSETQGMVVTEAMAAGVPVVALCAPGVNEVVRNNENGRLLDACSVADFAAELLVFADYSVAEREGFRQAAYATAESFSIQNSAQAALASYQKLVDSQPSHHSDHDDSWSSLLPLIQAEWDIILSYVQAAGESAFADAQAPSGDAL